MWTFSGYGAIWKDLAFGMSWLAFLLYSACPTAPGWPLQIAWICCYNHFYTFWGNFNRISFLEMPKSRDSPKSRPSPTSPRVERLDAMGHVNLQVPQFCTANISSAEGILCIWAFRERFRLQWISVTSLFHKLLLLFFAESCWFFTYLRTVCPS